MAEVDPPLEPDRVAGAPHPRETRRLIGQEDAERTFLASWHGGRLHHAWLLRGMPGIGKATLAYRIARTVIAFSDRAGSGLFGDGPAIPTTLDVPPECPVDMRIQAGSEPCLFVLRRSANPATGRMRSQIAIDDVREMRRFLTLSAADGGWRVVLIDAVDDMNPSSANALLKFLEEPPQRVLFLLVCHAPARLLPTVRSRCRALDLEPLSDGDVRAALAQAGVDLSVDGNLAELAGGSVGAALRLEAEDGVDMYRRLVEMCADGRSVDRTGMGALASQCTGRDAEARYRLAMELVCLLASRMALASAGAGRPEALEGEAALASKVAHDPRMAAQWAETASRISNTSRTALAVNLDPGQTIIDIMLELDAMLARVNPEAA